MPESLYKRKKKRTNDILEDAYSVAKRLGYLIDFERTDWEDVLTLNDDKFFEPKDLNDKKNTEKELESKNENPKVSELFALFYNSQKKIDKNLKMPTGHKKNSELNSLEELLNERSFEEIGQVILWSRKQPYWCSYLSSLLN